MAIYAHIFDGKVFEIIPPYTDPEGRDVPISERYTADFVAACVDVTDLDPTPEQGWLYDGDSFTPPKAQ